MENFINAILGTTTPSTFAVLFFFALFGAILSLLLQTTSREVKSPGSPIHFSWSFFIEDNWKRFLTGIMLIFVALRFTPELFGVEINEFWALAIGFLNDKLAQVIKDKTNILGKKK